MLKIIEVPKNPVLVDGWKEVLIKPTDEPLVPLGLFASYPYNLVHTDSIYAGEMESSPYGDRLDSSLLTSFLRKSVAERLEQARQLLPSGYTFVTWDSYRPLEVQRALLCC